MAGYPNDYQDPDGSSNQHGGLPVRGHLFRLPGRGEDTAIHVLQSPPQELLEPVLLDEISRTGMEFSSLNVALIIQVPEGLPTGH